MTVINKIIAATWPAPANVTAFTTTRHGGNSRGIYSSSNFGDHVGERAEIVYQNRQALLSSHSDVEMIPWLQQVHGKDIVGLTRESAESVADGAVSHIPGIACAVLTADCLPVLLCDQAGTVVAALHAGWRGLVSGIIEQGVRELREKTSADLMAWLGPAIGPRFFEVGPEVLDAFLQSFTTYENEQLLQLQSRTRSYFKPSNNKDHFLADIYGLATMRLKAAGVHSVYGGEHCTYSDDAQFYSYRRDGVTGRMASIVYLSKHA